MSTQTQTQTPATDQPGSESALRRLGGFIKKMALALVLTMILFPVLQPVIGVYSALVAMFLAGTAVNVYYADPEEES